MEEKNWLEIAEKTLNGNDCGHLNLNFDELQREFGHVYWIGGSGCAGKSTITKKIAAQFNLAIYHCDDHLKGRHARAESEQLPLPIITSFLANRNAGKTILGEDQADIGHDKYMALCFAYWQEEFSLVLDDLRAMPAKPMIAEGVPIVPWLAMKVALRSRVATLVGYDSFRRKNYMNPDRPEIVLNRFKASYDPERALENIVQANLLIAQTLFRCAQMRDFFVVEVDGSADADSVARTVATHFGL